jgi:hypothetical protein
VSREFSWARGEIAGSQHMRSLCRGIWLELDRIIVIGSFEAGERMCFYFRVTKLVRTSLRGIKQWQGDRRRGSYPGLMTAN